ncbi:MAG: dephospho-CoA kinase [Burkholderiales bacterium]
MAALRLGLTGGIGSGKSTVAQMLAHLGATLIDADAISRAATAANGVAIDALEAAFGSAFITPERALDRDQMRALVFADASAKARLESIVHPLVGQEIARQAEHAQRAGSHCIVFDIPLLVESRHWRASLQRVLVVDCSVQTQVERVTLRSGLDSAAVRRIVDAQVSRAQRLQAADYVLFNDGIALDMLERQVRQMAPLFGL